MARTLHKSQLHCSGVMSLQLTHVQGRTQEIFNGGGRKFREKYFALTKVQATLFTITFMSYMLF